jgi:hypothetical protein
MEKKSTATSASRKGRDGGPASLLRGKGIGSRHVRSQPWKRLGDLTALGRWGEASRTGKLRWGTASHGQWTGGGTRTHQIERDTPGAHGQLTRSEGLTVILRHDPLVRSLGPAGEGIRPGRTSRNRRHGHPVRSPHTRRRCDRRLPDTRHLPLSRRTAGHRSLH